MAKPETYFGFKQLGDHLYISKSLVHISRYLRKK